MKNYGFETAGTAGDPVPDWTVSLATGSSLSEVGTDSGVTPIQGSRQIRSNGSGSFNTITQTISLCPSTTSLTLTAWAREYIPGSGSGCTLRLCVGGACTNFDITATYSAYNVKGTVSGASATISAGLACGGGSTSSTRGFLDFVTVG